MSLMAALNDVSGPKKELLVHRVDHLAHTNPDALFAEFPVLSNSYDNGFHKVTYSILANAVNAVAWWLEATLGRGKSFETLAYVGPNDLRYTAFTLGAVKTGYLMLYVCPHNLAVAQANLFTLLKCRTLLLGDSNLSLADVGLDAVKPRVLDVPSVPDLLSKQYQHYPYEKTFEQARSDPLVALHTSGSAGFPKPIVWTHEFASAYIRQASLEPPIGFESQDLMFQKRRIIVTFPPYNGAYIVNHLFNAIPRRTVMISTIDTHMSTTGGLIRGLQNTTADVAFVAPSIVVTLARNPRKLDFVSRKVRLLMYCGGKVPQVLGDIVASRISLVDQYGASEIGLTAAVRSCNEDDSSKEEFKIRINGQRNELVGEEYTNGTTNGIYHAKHSLEQPKEIRNNDWNYIHFHPSIGSQMRHYQDDLYELVVTRTMNDYLTGASRTVNDVHPFYHDTPALPSPLSTPDPSLAAPLQPAFAFFPRASEYHTRDLWSPHPSKAGFWTLRARIDDLFKLNTGQTINPIGYEHQIMSINPSIEGVLMWGEGRERPGLLVELQYDADEEPQLNGNGLHNQTNGVYTNGEKAKSTNGVPTHRNVVNGVKGSTITNGSRRAKRNGSLSSTDGNYSSKRVQTLLRDLYLTIEEANSAFPTHMRVRPELLVLVHPETPMCRAGKGTIQRQLTLQRYSKEIEETYSSALGLERELRNGTAADKRSDGN